MSTYALPVYGFHCFSVEIAFTVSFFYNLYNDGTNKEIGWCFSKDVKLIWMINIFLARSHKLPIQVVVHLMRTKICIGTACERTNDNTLEQHRYIISVRVVSWPLALWWACARLFIFSIQSFMPTYATATFSFLTFPFCESSTSVRVNTGCYVDSEERCSRYLPLVMLVVVEILSHIHARPTFETWMKLRCALSVACDRRSSLEHTDLENFNICSGWEGFPALTVSDLFN